MQNVNNTYRYVNAANVYAKGVADASSGKKNFVDLGVGTSFNVTGYSGYQNFTAANFIVETSANGYSGSSWSSGGESGKIGAYRLCGAVTLVKTYSNGVLTAYNQVRVGLDAHKTWYDSVSDAACQSSYRTTNAAVHAYLIY